MAAGLMCALIALAALGCGGARKTAGAVLYFRPVLCTIPSYRPSQPAQAGSTLPVGTPPSARFCSAPNAAEMSTTPPFDDTPDATVVLPYYDDSLRYVLGPADMNGSAVAKTTVVRGESGGYQVELTFTPAGAAELDLIASQRYPFYAADPAKPPFESMEALELNGTVVAAPPIQAGHLHGTVVISGSSAAPLTQREAEGLAGNIDLSRSEAPLASRSPSTSTTT